MRRMAVTLLAGLSAASVWGAGGPFVLGQEREWEFLGAGRFTGTFVKMESNRVQIAMPDGVVREFWPGWAEGVSVSYLQRSMCRLPENPSRPTPTAGNGPVIALDAASLASGPLARWPNRGRLGGTFTAMNLPPAVRELQGRKAVVFEHSPWLCPLEFQTMVSDFVMPTQLIDGSDLTVVAWLCNTGGIVDRETFLCWSSKDCGELDGPDFSYGCYQAMQWYHDTLNIPVDRFPKLNQWHQLVFTVTSAPSAQRDCEIRVYADGRFLTSRKFRKPEAKLLSDNLVFLGCAWEAWWGHAWQTRPARPYTGGIGRLEVYDRALSETEIQALQGKDSAPPPPASPSAAASVPVPANAARDVDTGLVRLQWKPSPDALTQNLYFGTNRDAVASGTATCVKNLKAGIAQSYVAVDLGLARLDCEQTYYWRVEQVPENKAAAVPADLWSFTTSAFDLEDDGPISIPFPPEVRQDGFYSRYMECEGDPIISPPGIFDVEMRAARHSIQKFTAKRPDIVKALQAANAACHLATHEHPGWGWSQFNCACYGSGPAILREGAIAMHEMGHQFHMSGGEMLEPDFRHRLAEAFDANRRERKWIGDYGGRNMWENVAVCASWWINDGTQDEGGDSSREALREGDPRIHAFLADYWPGDTVVELHPAALLKTDASGRIQEWGNNGGVEYFKPGAGWRYYERSVGRFMPQGVPALRTVGGVSAVAFSGRDSLAWTKMLWEAFEGNRAWSVECWVRRDAPASGNETLVAAVGPNSAQPLRFTWGTGDESYVLPTGQRGRWGLKPDAGSWHHLIYVYTGGGLENGPGQLCVYVDGRLDSSASYKLALPDNASLVIGQEFTGALAHVRLYNYAVHPLQIEALRAEAAPWYAREPLAVAGDLLVDLDARTLSPCPKGETWTFYPAELKQPWLRSWANRGTLAGKLHNERRTPDPSEPRVAPVQGIPAVRFAGKDRMVSSFAGAPAIGTIEAWVAADPGANSGSLLQWGSLEVPSTLIPAGGWHHLALTLDSGKASAYVDGRRVTAPSLTGAPPAADRLALGAAWDGHQWRRFLRGSVAQVRIHRGVLSAEQVARNYRDSDLLLPAAPDPAPESTAVVARQPRLNWQTATSASAGSFDVYLGTNAAEVASATRTSPAYLGQHTPNFTLSALKPGTRYFWRVEPANRSATARRGAVWSFRTAEGLLIDLDAQALPEGPVAQWANTGAGGGRFTPGSEKPCWQPEVVTLDGRKGLDFAGKKFLLSSMTTPADLLGGKPFTVAVRGFCRDVRGLPYEQIVLSWGRRSEGRAEFGWGWSPKWGAFVAGEDKKFAFGGSITNLDGWHHNAPLLQGWRHIAYAYSGGANPTLRIYVDGKLNAQIPVALDIKPGSPICLGGAMTTALEPDWPFGGILSEVAIAGRALSDAEIARLATAPSAPSGADWMVRLDAAGLPDGAGVPCWTNQGSLGGAFVLADEPPRAPKAETVAGRKAVTFNGQSTFLCSDILTPANLTGDHPFTAEMWVFNPRFEERETVFALAPQVAFKSFPYDASERGADFNYGGGNEAGTLDTRPGVFMTGHGTHDVGWKQKAPTAGEWHHIACVYSGGYKGEMQVYVDGQLDNRRAYYSLYTMAGYPMRIGGAWNTATGLYCPFSGSLAGLRLYDYARTAEEIRLAAATPRSLAVTPARPEPSR